jgi:hypothetical protein
MRIEGLNCIVFPGLKIETSMPRTKTCSWGPRDWGSQGFVVSHSCVEKPTHEWGTRIFCPVLERSGGRWESHSISFLL